MAKKRYNSPTVKKSTASPVATYRNTGVKGFTEDLSNYAELRRGLSKTMREQTLGVKELRKASAATQKQYIDILNQWRQQSQVMKKERATIENPVEELFRKAAETDKFYTEDERAKLAAANIKLKTMGADQVKMELLEALDNADRKRNQDFYQVVWFLSKDMFEPGKATDEMLRQIIMSGTIEEYPGQKDEIIAEYMSRLGSASVPDQAATETQYASERNAYRQDLLAIAVQILGY